MACFGKWHRDGDVDERFGQRRGVIFGGDEDGRISQEEVKTLMVEKERVVMAYEKGMMLFAIKEAEWEKEREKLKAELRRLKKVSDSGGGGGNRSEEFETRKDKGDKWKALYLSIKSELDDLIRVTRNGEQKLCVNVEEEMIEELKTEVLLKEETIERLRTKLAAMELEGCKREREMDILRQSLRIMTGKIMPNSC